MTTGIETVDVGVKAGDVLAGKYRVERVLGVGGMGVVVAAHHLQLDERVALKFLRPEALESPEWVARFAREARAAVKIKSEHVARVIDVGSLDDGAPYIVMEYLEGGDLSAMLEKNGVLPFEQAVDFVLQACEAIAQAHALGIVHRDLKPANLFCIRRPDGQLSIKVLDFGISKAMARGSFGSGNQDMSMTRTTAIVGSPIYMSPEQMQSSKNVDLRTDVWALGIILYELLTGRVPFDSETVTELAIRIATEPTPPMRARRADVPAGLERVILRCLEKSPDRRFRNVGELAAALVDFGSKRAAASLEKIQGTLLADPARAELASMPGVSAAGGGSTLAAWQSGSSTKRGGKAAVVIAAAVAVATLATAGVFLVRRSSSSSSATSSGSAPVMSAEAPPPSIEAPTPPVADTPNAAGVAPPPGATATASTAPHPSPGPGPLPASKGLGSRPTATPRPNSSPTQAPARAKANCDTPYYFDAQGNRIFKKECL
ncbi:MAG TPA: protein kinase [Polyangiaceae bacterium]